MIPTRATKAAGSAWSASRRSARCRRPVTLEAVKAEKRLAKMALVANSRLSVQPVTDEEWRIVCAMGWLKTVIAGSEATLQSMRRRRDREPKLIGVVAKRRRQRTNHNRGKLGEEVALHD